MLNRQTLDVAIPMIFGIIIAVLAMTAPGAIGVAAVVGGGAVGVYFAALRNNVPEPRVRLEGSPSGLRPRS